MGKISVVINTINEELNLPRALASVEKFADEIVVVDMKSVDRTVEIAKEYGAKVWEHERMGYVEPARNFAIEKSTSEWILVLDADEEIPETLASKLVYLAQEEKADYYAVPRKNIIFNKWVRHSRWWPDYNIRFFKKGKVAWSEMIHSVPITYGKGADVEAKEDLAIIHYHYQSIEQFIERLNLYTGVQAKNLIDKGYEFSWKDLVKKPSAEFFSRYFANSGYKDGLHGLALAGLQAVSEFVLYLKLWQSTEFNKENINATEVIKTFKEVQSDLNYWSADTLVKSGKGPLQRVKRKFKLS